MKNANTTAECYTLVECCAALSAIWVRHERQNVWKHGRSLGERPLSGSKQMLHIVPMLFARIPPPLAILKIHVVRNGCLVHIMWFCTFVFREKVGNESRAVWCETVNNEIVVIYNVLFGEHVNISQVVFVIFRLVLYLLVFFSVCVWGGGGAEGWWQNIRKRGRSLLCGLWFTCLLVFFLDQCIKFSAASSVVGTFESNSPRPMRTCTLSSSSSPIP